MIQLTKVQAEVVEKVVERYKGDKAKAAMNYQPNHLVGIETFTRCMIEGWEVEKTREEKVLELYNKYSYKGSMRPIVRRVLEALEIKIKGIND